MKDRSLSKYDIMTVGEASGVSPDDATGSGKKMEKFNIYSNLNIWDCGIVVILTLM